jgi:group I intron endonuclease
MTREEIYNLPKGAGIYCIKNSITGKCYIGQSIKLQKRLKKHWNSWNNPMYSHIVLYKAIKKYGIENFEVTILESFHDSLCPGIRSKLDELEKKYIQEYDSFNNGYNSTLGGDGGVLGYTHTEETKNYLRELRVAQEEEKSKDPSNWVKAKNLETNIVVIAHNRKELSELTGIKDFSIKKCLIKKQLLANKVWILANYEEEFPEVPEYGTMEFEELRTHQFKALSNKDEILEYIKENPFCSYGEISQNYKLCKKTFYNYKNELGIKPENRIDTKVTKEEFLAYAIDHTKEECMHKFNILERLYYKYRKKYKLDEVRNSQSM